MMKRHINNLLQRSPFRGLGGLLFLLLTACSSDAPFTEPDTPSSPQSGTFTLFTRGEGTEISGGFQLPEGFSQPQETQLNERIWNWVVVFIDGNNTIQEVCYGVENPANSSDLTDTHTFDPKMPDGIYDIYGFANLSAGEVAKMIYKDSPSEISNFDDLKGETASVAETYDIDSEIYVAGGEGEKDRIPMSGYRHDVQIKNNDEVGTGTNRNYIEVIRMLAKVELKFLNMNESNTIQFDKVTFGMVQTDGVAIAPDYENLTANNKAATIGESSTDTKSVKIIPSDDELKILGNNGSNELDVIFYVRESDASVTLPATGKFMLSFGLLEGGEKTIKTEHYAVTEELQWINRNDHIVIPVRIEDYFIDWKVLYYPPIGGYPAVIEDKDPYNFYYYCDFKTPGEFQIIPTIYDSTGKPINKKYDMEIGDITTTQDSGVSGDFFVSKPDKSINGDEIIGSVGTNTGSAVVPVTLTFDKNEASPGITRTRNIYIRRSK